MNKDMMYMTHLKQIQNSFMTKRNRLSLTKLGLATSRCAGNWCLMHSRMYLEPLLDVVEGLLVRDIVDHDDAVSASVVRRGDGPEPLLTRGVPNLQWKFLKSWTSTLPDNSSNLKLDGLSVKLNSSNFEIYSYRGNVRFSICVIRKSAREINCKSKFRCLTQCSPEKETRFPHTGVTNKEELEQVVTEKKKRIKHWSKVFNFVTILPLPTHSQLMWREYVTISLWRNLLTIRDSLWTW